MKSKNTKKKIEQKLNSSVDSLSLIPISDRDHFMYKLYYKGEYLEIVQISMGSREIGDELIGRMARQLGIKSRQLKDLVSCTFWGKDFVKESSLIDGNK